MSRPSRERGRLLRAILTEPILWGILASWGFYEILPALPVGRDLLVRYLSSHPLEYLETGLFLIGLTIILKKGVAFVGERLSLKALTSFGSGQATEFSQAAQEFRTQVMRLPDHLYETYWERRLSHLVAFFDGKNSSEGLNDHLNYLTEADADRLQGSHSLLQTVIWSIPILGFLGTVMGITLAIANVTPDQLDTSLDEVTGGLAVAFDTTAIALAYSLVLGFASLFIKRAEEDLLSEIDERCRLELHRCLPAAAPAESPLLESERHLAAAILERSSAVIEDQTRIWTDAVETVRTQWQETLEAQRQGLSLALSEGTDSTLHDHAGQLARFRDEFLQAQESMLSRLTTELTDVADRQQRATLEWNDSIREFGTQLQAIVRQDSEQRSHESRQLTETLQVQFLQWTNQVADWQRQLADVSSAIIHQHEALTQQSQQADSLLEKEEALLRLQDTLNRNLEAIRTSEAFDETLHSLSAAVHLLTVRTRARDAA